MKKNHILVGAVLILTLIGGCNQNSNERTDIYIGKEGVSFDFIEDAPPFETFENSEITIGLNLENKGASDATGIVALNVEDDYLTIAQDTTQIFELKGKTEIMPFGEQKILFFDSMISSLRNMEELHTSTIYATICYDYTTTLKLDQICVDTDPFNLGDLEKACELTDLSFSSGEGGPVGVTKVSENTLVSSTEDIVKPFYILTIENLGYGQVVKSNIANTICGSNQFDRKYLNKIRIDAYLGSDRLDCDTDNGYVHLFDGIATVKCTLGKGVPKTSSTYITQLRAVLEYGYTETSSVDFKIKKLEASALT